MTLVRRSGAGSTLLRSTIFGKKSNLLRSNILKRVVFVKIEKSTLLKRVVIREIEKNNILKIVFL